MKRYLGIAILLLLVAGIAWYAMSAGWFSGPVIPSNPPTAEELERIEEIKESSSQIAPDAKPGAGVYAPGTLPPPPTPSTTTEAVASSTETL
jgi:hypothetical protein